MNKSRLVPEADALESVATIGQGNECDEHSKFYLREPLSPWKTLPCGCCTIWCSSFFSHSHWSPIHHLIAVLPLVPVMRRTFSLQRKNKTKLTIKQKFPFFNKKLNSLIVVQTIFSDKLMRVEGRCIGLHMSGIAWHHLLSSEVHGYNCQWILHGDWRLHW